MKEHLEKSENSPYETETDALIKERKSRTGARFSIETESSEGQQLRQLCEQESNELRKTITKLERLLAQEKDELSRSENAPLKPK